MKDFYHLNWTFLQTFHGFLNPEVTWIRTDVTTPFSHKTETKQSNSDVKMMVCVTEKTKLSTEWKY